MIGTVKQLFDEYRQQLYTDASLTEQSRLENARKVLNEILNKQLQEGEGCLDSEAVHLATDSCTFFGGDKQFTVNVLCQYLTQPLTPEEEFWARWELVDNLALLRQCAEMVEKQQDFLEWARKCLPQDRLLGVMSDGTQALCWTAISKGNEWLQIFNDIFAAIIPSPENRYERFYYMRTASLVCVELGRFNESLQIINRIRELANEDPRWEESFGLKIESYALEMKMQWKQQDVLAVRRIGKEASMELAAYSEQQIDLNFDKKSKLSTLHHNLAAPLYFSCQYDLAIPLFRSAIDLGMYEHWTYSWLAASLWATTKSRPEVLKLLKQGSKRFVGNYDSWMRLAEFQDVVTDAEFLKAANRQIA